MEKADLIIHPVRLRMLRELHGRELTTQELADRLPDVPKSSLYRHLRLLLDGELVEVSAGQLVNGILEKTFRLGQAPSLDLDAIAQWTHDDHVRYFTSYALLLIRDFDAYLRTAGNAEGPVNLGADRVGYREVTLYATFDELDQALRRINAVVEPLLENKAVSGKRPYKLVTALHPLV